MSHQLYQINSPKEGERDNRCSLRPLTEEARGLAGKHGTLLQDQHSQFGFCTRGLCANCPQAKCSDMSELRIESGDTVRIEASDPADKRLARFARFAQVVGFGATRNGLRNGFVHLSTLGGLKLRLPLSSITLYSKAA